VQATLQRLQLFSNHVSHAEAASSTGVLLGPWLPVSVWGSNGKLLSG